jgi:hypothetical protein
MHPCGRITIEERWTRILLFSPLVNMWMVFMINGKGMREQYNIRRRSRRKRK